MKKLLIIVFTLSVTTFYAKDQCICVQDKLTVTGANIVRSGEEVLVSFRAQAEKDMVKGNASYVFFPVITNGEYKVALPAVVIRGKQATRIQARNQKLSSQWIRPEFQIAQPEEPIDYSASVPFQSWMEDATLVMESSSWGCSASEIYADRLLANHILLPEPDMIMASGPVRTLGDTLSLSFSFVIPESQWNKYDPLYDDNREQSLVVYYPTSKSDIQPDFKDNRIILTNLIAVINTILGSPNSRVTRIVIAGFASPEGSFAYNDRLAWERAVSVKEFIMNHTSIKSNDICLYNGSEDWRGLRAMVAESDLYDKAEILRIIDTVPLFSVDGRRKERIQQLKELNGGISYRYMLEHFFPLLRNSAFIRIYYSNTIA